MSSLRDQLQSIYDRQGRLTPALVVDAARPKKSALHARFEWDDAVAGDAYRREQAHELIQSVRIVREREDKEPLSIRAFHAVRDEEGSAYRPTDDILDDPMLTQMLLGDMKREWQTLRRRYERFVEFRELVLADLEASA
jgi:hypothetical protein